MNYFVSILPILNVNMATNQLILSMKDMIVIYSMLRNLVKSLDNNAQVFVVCEILFKILFPVSCDTI